MLRLLEALMTLLSSRTACLNTHPHHHRHRRRHHHPQDSSLVPGYDGALLRLAVDLADRFMPAFRTPTGVPLSWVNLRHVRGRLPPLAGALQAAGQGIRGGVWVCVVEG
jgi:hypothetical protein